MQLRWIRNQCDGKLFGVLVLVLVWLSAWAPVARADFAPCLISPTESAMCQFQDIQVDVLYGTSQLRSSGGTLLSTNTAMAIDFPLWPDLEPQLIADTLPWTTDGVPTYIRDHLAGFIGNSNVGAFVNPQGVVDFATAQQQLVGLLQLYPQPFTVTSDHLDNVGDLFGYLYTSIVPAGPPNFYYSGNVTVNYYQETIVDTVVATPEPDALWLTGAVAIATLLVCAPRRRKSVGQFQTRYPA